jgi:ubiquinone/menaquinone biosynthesis C-methylase UbiE
MLLLSAHELRTDTARGDLFAELRRVLGPGGRVVVAEHLRDWANFAAFGPGVLHFHSRRTWTRCFARHRFDVHAEFSITPFVRVFVLRRLT